MLNVGDKVKVKRKIEKMGIARSFPTSRDMTKYEGEEFVVKEHDNIPRYGDVYFLRNTNGELLGVANGDRGWCWLPEMLEKVSESNKEMKFVKKGV